MIALLTTTRATLRGGSRLPDRAFQGVCLVSGLLVLVVLGLILLSTGNEALPAFRQEGLGFLTSKRWDPARGHFGALAFVYGTLVVSTIALLIAVPISLGLALFIVEIAPRKLRTAVVYLVDLLAAIPSVVYGLWGILVLAPHFGRSFMTAGIILAIMITPIVTSISKEVFATVPSDQKEGALALGATRFEMVRGAVFPYGRTGLVGAVMLGLGRAMGETIAVALVIGSVPSIRAQLFEPGDAMAAVIANQFGEAAGTHRAALISLGVVLFVMTVIINVSARRLSGGTR